MLVSTEDCIPILVCPRTKKPLRRESDDVLVVEGVAEETDRSYRILDGTPVLVDFDQSVLVEEEVLKSSAQSTIPRASYGGVMARVKRLLSPEKKGTQENVSRMIGDLEKLGRTARLLVVGGGSIGQGMEPIYEHPDISLYGFDIYATSFVQFVADAHNMPLPDEFFDAVIIQAVLEHVLQPATVVAEIWRVLAAKGLVYAETPFMQQVHEGPFDFTRFTESGHRYLFRHFAAISSGANGGPGLQFMWAADYLARSLFRSVKAGKIAKLAFFWTQYLDRLIPEKYAVDGASGVYFYGRKSEKAMSETAIIDHYQGAQRGDH